MGGVVGSDEERGEVPARQGHLARRVSKLYDAPYICDLIDSVVLGAGRDDDVVEQLVAIEVWCMYLREMMRDTDRKCTQAAVVANQTAELSERLR